MHRRLVFAGYFVHVRLSQNLCNTQWNTWIHGYDFNSVHNAKRCFIFDIRFAGFFYKMNFPMLTASTLTFSPSFSLSLHTSTFSIRIHLGNQQYVLGWFFFSLNTIYASFRSDYVCNVQRTCVTCVCIKLNGARQVQSIFRSFLACTIFYLIQTCANTQNKDAKCWRRVFNGK